LKKGYSLEESKEKVAQLQSQNSNKYTKKRKEKPEKYNDVQPNQLGYWIKKVSMKKQNKKLKKDKLHSH